MSDEQIIEIDEEGKVHYPPTPEGKILALTQEVRMLRAAFREVEENLPAYIHLDEVQVPPARIGWIKDKINQTLSNPSPTGEAIGEAINALDFYQDSRSYERQMDEHEGKIFCGKIDLDMGRKASEALSKCRAKGLIN